MGEPLPSHNFHHSVTFILPLSQNRHSTHRSVTFILPSCQNSHRTHIVMKKSIRFLIYIISNPNQTCNKHKMNILWTPYEITPYIGYFFYHYTILILEIKLIFVLCRMCLWRTHTACTCICYCFASRLWSFWTNTSMSFDSHTGWKTEYLEK